MNRPNKKVLMPVDIRLKQKEKLIYRIMVVKCGKEPRD